MAQISLKNILEGWRRAGSEGQEGELLGGYLVPEVDILIDDGTSARLPEDRSPIGESRLVWVKPESLRPGPYKNIAVATSRSRFSGANRHRCGTIRSVALLHSFRDDPEKLEMACVLIALVGARNARPVLLKSTENAVRSCLEALEIKCLQDIWVRSNSAPMPTEAPKAIQNMTVKMASKGALGTAMRQWHQNAFEDLVPVNATPVSGGIGALTLADFEDVVGRYSTGMNAGHGEEMWKELDRAGLEALVWSEPRSLLSLRLGVSDVAIGKRCRRENINFPPRGYWQRVEARIDPRPILEKNNVTPPDFVARELDLRYNE
jgi:hypothetical protein